MKQRVWQPTRASIQNSNLRRFMSSMVSTQDIVSYAELHRWSIENREQFWQSIWEFFELKYSRRWQQILVETEGMFRPKWFVGSQLNFAENLLRYRDQQIALEFYNEWGQPQRLSYYALYQQVAVLADAFKRSGLQAGDRVAAVLPNIPQAVIAMLACTSIGAIWSSCSPDFGVSNLMDRFGQISPKILLYCNGYYYKGKYHDCAGKIAALVKEIQPQQVIVMPYVSSLEAAELNNIVGIEYADYIKPSLTVTEIEFAQLDFQHPVYILYSSGTTGVPKCIVHGAGGTLLQHFKELGLHVDLGRRDKLFYYTSIGWMMWNWQLSALALGATVVLYDGCPFYPEQSALLDLVAKQNVSVFGCSAKYISTLDKAGLDFKFSLAQKPLRMILSTGSPLVAESYDYVMQKLKSNVQLCSISGGTDIISCFALGNPLSAVYRGELQGPGLGMAVEVFDDNGQAVRQQKGELVCTASFPSMPVYFWNDTDHQKYHHAYFEGFPHVWTHGDYAEISKYHGLIIYGRSDATLNPGGVRIGTAEIYRQLDQLQAIEEAVVIGQRWQDDQRIILFVQLVPSVKLDDDLIAKIKYTLRTQASPHHVPTKIIQIEAIPRTYNGKISELAVTNIINHQPVSNLAALANPDSLEEYKHLEELLT